MALVRDPVLTPIPIDRLRPTQVTVGMHEVKTKRRALRQRATRRIGRFLGDHMIPVILGPGNRHYIIDHHHLALALLGAGVKNVLVTVIADLSMLEPDQFWIVLDHHSWVHPYDQDGRRVNFTKIPKSVDRLKDDPFRSLAESCAAPAALPRTRRRSASSCGPISCAVASSAGGSNRTFRRRCGKP